MPLLSCHTAPQAHVSGLENSSERYGLRHSSVRSFPLHILAEHEKYNLIRRVRDPVISIARGTHFGGFQDFILEAQWAATWLMCMMAAAPGR
jgi:hypothetical protein